MRLSVHRLGLNITKMKTLYIIRHTTPDIQQGICYGYSDIDVNGNFKHEANEIKSRLDKINPTHIISSPLKRCYKLANELFPNMIIKQSDSLKELNFGDWEMQRWDSIDKEFIGKWSKDFMNIAPPNGETFNSLFVRSNEEIDDIMSLMEDEDAGAIITHSGVQRSILMKYLSIPANKIFNWQLGYGAIIKLTYFSSDFQQIEVIKG